MLIQTQVTSSVHYRSYPDSRSITGMLDPSPFLHRSLGIRQYTLPDYSRAIAHRIFFLHRRLDRTFHNPTRPICQCHRLFLSPRDRVWCSTHSRGYRCSIVNAAQIDRHGHGMHDLFTRRGWGRFLGDQCSCLQHSPEELPTKICRQGCIGRWATRCLPRRVHRSLE